jgi:hypothetical protein
VTCFSSYQSSWLSPVGQIKTAVSAGSLDGGLHMVSAQHSYPERESGFLLCFCLLSNSWKRFMLLNTLMLHLKQKTRLSGRVFIVSSSRRKQKNPDYWSGWVFFAFLEKLTQNISIHHFLCYLTSYGKIDVQIYGQYHRTSLCSSPETIMTDHPLGYIVKQISRGAASMGANAVS